MSVRSGREVEIYSQTFHGERIIFSIEFECLWAGSLESLFWRSPWTTVWNQRTGFSSRQIFIRLFSRCLRWKEVERRERRNFLLEVLMSLNCVTNIKVHFLIKPTLITLWFQCISITKQTRTARNRYYDNLLHEFKLITHRVHFFFRLG